MKRNTGSRLLKDADELELHWKSNDGLSGGEEPNERKRPDVDREV